MRPSAAYFSIRSGRIPSDEKRMALVVEGFPAGAGAAATGAAIRPITRAERLSSVTARSRTWDDITWRSSSRDQGTMVRGRRCRAGAGPHRTAPRHIGRHTIAWGRRTVTVSWPVGERRRNIRCPSAPRLLATKVPGDGQVAAGCGPPGTVSGMDVHPAVAERLNRLAPDQRAAATAPPGPILCVAPAGSGKTTTLVARIAWLLSSGQALPGSVAAITFNRRAAIELGERLTSALEPLGLPGDAAQVRTFHALGLDILRDAGRRVEPLVDRIAILRRIFPGAGPAGWRRLDTAFSKLKLDVGVTAEDVRTDPAPGPIARAFLAYEDELAAEGGLDFDDLVARTLRLLATDSAILERWRKRCHDLLVDEAQDLDRAQLQLALLLAAPTNRIFLVGDDDQSIYGWRLADVRRVLALADGLPELRRVDLVVNYRCPAIVIDRAVRLVEHNLERFEKTIRARPDAPGPVVLAADSADEIVRAGRVLQSWSGHDGTQAILTRTNRELLPAIAAALGAGIPFRPPPIELLVALPDVDACLAAADASDPNLPLLARLESVRAA